MKNLVLIGMPGSGKSTVGVMLAKRLAMGFVDTDLRIQTREGRTLQQIVDADGYLRLREIEEAVLCQLDVSSQVISTGGSAVYSAAAMASLSDSGTVVFLDVDEATMRHRIGEAGQRGLARAPTQTLAELYDERRPLYCQHADVTVDAAGGVESVVNAIVSSLNRSGGGPV